MKLNFISMLTKLFGASSNKSSEPKGKQKGTVKFFNRNKGFGFITSADGKEVYVHISGLKQKIRTNDRVVFEVKESEKGLSAVNVSRG